MTRARVPPFQLLAGEPSWGHRVFRRVLEALANPGLSVTLPGCDLAGDTAWALLCCGWDTQAAVAMVGPVYLPRAPTARVDEADVALVAGQSSAGAVTRARRGSEEHPEDGAAVIYRIDRWNGDGIVSQSAAQGLGPRDQRRRKRRLPLASTLDCPD